MKPVISAASIARAETLLPARLVAAGAGLVGSLVCGRIHNRT